MSEALREALLSAVSDELRATLSARADLDAVLARCLQQACEHGLAVDETRLGGALGRLQMEGATIDEVAVADVYLAEVCGLGDGAALRRFEQLYGPELDRAIAKSPTLGYSADEFRQLVMDRLFVSEGDGPPRISKYLGKGTLKAWVRVMTSRFVIDLSRRRDRATSSDDGLADKLNASEDTELDYLRHAYGPALDAAFEQAIASLSVRERNLLRQRYLHDMAADALARMYGVHRSTMFLWLDKARASLVDNVRKVLAQRVPGDQLESVVGMLGSKLQVSVRRMLDSRLESE